VQSEELILDTLAPGAGSIFPLNLETASHLYDATRPRPLAACQLNITIQAAYGLDGQSAGRQLGSNLSSVMGRSGCARRSRIILDYCMVALNSRQPPQRIWMPMHSRINADRRIKTLVPRGPSTALIL